MGQKNTKTKAVDAAAKPGTKAALLISLLQSKDGADVAAISAKLGWQTHTVRAALTRLSQSGHSIEKTKTGTPARTFYRITAKPDR